MPKMMKGETVKIELEIPSKTIAALKKIASHFTLTPDKLAVYLLKCQLAIETDELFDSLVEEKVESFLMENCLDNKTLKHLQSEVKDILRGIHHV